MLHCILIANELVDDAKRRGKEILLFKADFGKAYDSVDWHFLDLTMEKMGFNETWRGWISECLRTASLLVLVNWIPAK